MKLYYWLHDWQLPGQQHKGADKVEIPTDAAGLCAWLNARRVPSCLSLADPDKSAEQAYGERRLYDPEPVEVAPTITAAPRAPSYTEQSIKLDEDFDRLPLARQLDLAARAMENARLALP